MKFKLFILTCVLVPMLGGCATMFDHYRESDYNTEQFAIFTAIANICVSNNFLEPNDVEEYLYYSKLLFSISVYDKNIYEQSYNETINNSSKDTLASILNGCEQAKPKFASEGILIKNEYNRRSQSLGKARVAVLQSTSNSLDSISSAMDNRTQQLNSYVYEVPEINIKSPGNKINKTPIYNASECTGSIVNGKCMGTINKTSNQKYCYGTIINGNCSGYVGY